MKLMFIAVNQRVKKMDLKLDKRNGSLKKARVDTLDILQNNDKLIFNTNI